MQKRDKSGNAIKCDCDAKYSNSNEYVKSIRLSLNPFSDICEVDARSKHVKSIGFIETFLCFLLKS